MRIEYHPAVEQDVAEALRRYDSVSQQLGSEFNSALRRLIAVAGANLKRFPYHFIYRELPDGIRVTLVRHHRRNPHLGMGRI